VHSLKNTFVAVVLLGVSYFVYNGLTNPNAVSDESEPGMGLQIEMPEGGLTDTIGQVVSNAKEKVGQTVQDFSQSIGDLRLPPLKSAPVQQTDLSDFSQNLQPQRNIQPRQDLRTQDFNPQPSHFNDSRALAQNNDQSFRGSSTQNAAPQTPLTDNANQFQASPSRQTETETQLSPIARRNDVQQANSPNTVAPRNDFRLAGHTDEAKNTFTSTTATLEMAWPKVDSFVNNQQYREALSELSQFYGSPNLPNTDRTKLLEWLDALAGKVIYSSEHNLTPNAYVIQANDTMQSIADRWGVPAQLVYNVNQAKISNPLTLSPGNELKVIKGPFRGDLDLQSQTLTLFLGDLYAGRFAVNSSNPPAAGQYRVGSKVANGGSLGEFEVQLTHTATGAQCGFHATSNGQGSIGLAKGDAQDLFGILSQGSTVTIK
jgi:LysM repeat protein